ncbi:hypothetical protein [Oceanobacillus iheyensis HTE831]|uniref:Uncharacterized protein n=2 Tax=Oceanobacillus iheyensis TaxID=182710 RepID=Q8EML5_OCEIH|nr:hypothetical protein [Oceanobacillus iheyensis HTE831]
MGRYVMIEMTSTPNYAGMTITGDFYDFDQLYEALHRIVGGEGEYPAYSSARLRVLGLCYDIRHANMGHREFIYKDHGLSIETMQWLGTVGPSKNLYLSFNTYYPEILFILMALNDFIDLYQRKPEVHSKWDLTVLTVRKFQATINQCLRETIPPQTFKLMMKNMNKYSVHFQYYFDQYLDQLNIRFLEWNKEKRLKNISIMAKRIAEQGKEYQQLKEEISEAAFKYNCNPTELRYSKEYPEYEEIDW